MTEESKIEISAQADVIVQYVEDDSQVEPQAEKWLNYQETGVGPPLSHPIVVIRAQKGPFAPWEKVAIVHNLEGCENRIMYQYLGWDPHKGVYVFRREREKQG